MNAEPSRKRTAIISAKVRERVNWLCVAYAVHSDTMMIRALADATTVSSPNLAPCVFGECDSGAGDTGQISEQVAELDCHEEPQQAGDATDEDQSRSPDPSQRCDSFGRNARASVAVAEYA